MSDATRTQTDDDDDQDLAAVREALAELQAGDQGLPLDAAFDQVRRGGADFIGTGVDWPLSPPNSPPRK